MRISDWSSDVCSSDLARGMLRGEATFQPEPLAPYAPPLLPPNERRRATPVVRQAFRVAEEAIAGRDAGDLATVFAGSDADMAILPRISEIGRASGRERMGR